jgi:2-polyprenyl-3-methyl-5-hydroxy-6-metoxy-1,4-benzoquinol methylase
MSNATNIIERLIPGVNRRYGSSSSALRQHLVRYRLAAAYVQRGQSVLDAASGSGYGSMLLAAAGGDVVAVDRDATAIRHGRRFYGHPSIRWIRADLEEWAAGRLRLRGCQALEFHRVVSLETIEHVRDPLALLQAFRGHLRRDGALICSVPIVDSMHFDPYHKHDFSEESFTTLLRDSGFHVVDRLVQEDTFLTVVARWTDEADLEGAPVPRRRQR